MNKLTPVDPEAVVKWADNKAMLEAFGATDIRQGSRMVLASGDAEDSWEDYYEVPFTVLDKLRAALA
jgi:hypothetical protein